MKAMINTIRVGALIAAFVAGPMFAQTGPASGTPGSETPNASAAPQTPQANSSYQADKDGNMGLNLGWLGLLGLGGLLGLRRGTTNTNAEPM